MPTYIIVILVFLLAASAAPASEGAREPYLTDLARRADEAKLADQRFWHLLLHYRKNTLGGYTSEADDPGFFLAREGRTDPQAELDATLAHFFTDEVVGRSRQPAQCAFIARYHWLKEQLAFDDERLPPQRCERFDRWYAELNPRSISLIFPSAFMNNPASMFGHTLLRIDQKGQTDQTRLLAYTINYAADVPPNQGVLYAIRGIFGVYDGYFSTIPYYLKVQEYGDIENRDIWEYRLNLTEGQIRWMLMHAWELGNAYFDYYFFKENCSYHLLSLLEVADPSLHLRDTFHLWTVPAETVRLLAQQPGLVGDIVYRPSRSTQVRRKREALSSPERRWLNRVIRDPSEALSPGFAALPPARRALLLDTASDYFRYERAGDPGDADSYKAKNRTVLIERSKLRIPSPDIEIEPWTASPEKGHDTSRAGVGIGWRGSELITDVSFRVAYHDLLDPDAGYSPDEQIELLGVVVRYYEERNQARLEELTFVDVVSLSPMDSLFHTPSWKFGTRLDTVRTEQDQLFMEWNVNGGLGVALESQLLRREVYFAFAELDANVSEAFADNHRVGGGVTAGVVATLTDRWKLLASGSYLAYPLGDRSDDARAFVGTRYTLARNWALRFEFKHRDHDNQGVFTVQAFF